MDDARLTGSMQLADEPGHLAAPGFGQFVVLLRDPALRARLGLGDELPSQTHTQGEAGDVGDDHRIGRWRLLAKLADGPVRVGMVARLRGHQPPGGEQIHDVNPMRKSLVLTALTAPETLLRPRLEGCRVGRPCE